MGLIIHHRAMSNALRFSLAFLAPVFLLLPSTVHAQDANKAFSTAIGETIEILKKEIARDEETVSSNMTIPRLRQLREKLAVDLDRKGKALASIKTAKHPAIESAVQAVEDSYNAETRIIADTRINEAVQIRALRAIRENLPKKKQALTELESWLAAKPN